MAEQEAVTVSAAKLRAPASQQASAVAFAAGACRQARLNVLQMGLNTAQVTLFNTVRKATATLCRQHLEATLHRKKADLSERDALIAADAAAAEARRHADVSRRAAERAALQMQATAGQLEQIGEHASRRCCPMRSMRRLFLSGELWCLQSSECHSVAARGARQGCCGPLCA